MMSVDDDDYVDGADESVAECWTPLMVMIMLMLKNLPKKQKLDDNCDKEQLRQSLYRYTGNVIALSKEIAV